MAAARQASPAWRAPQVKYNVLLSYIQSQLLMRTRNILFHRANVII